MRGSQGSIIIQTLMFGAGGKRPSGKKGLARMATTGEEAVGLDQVQGSTNGQAAAGNVACVWGDFRLYQDDVYQAAMRYFCHFRGIISSDAPDIGFFSDGNDCLGNSPS